MDVSAHPGSGFVGEGCVVVEGGRPEAALDEFRALIGLEVETLEYFCETYGVGVDCYGEDEATYLEGTPIYQLAAAPDGSLPWIPVITTIVGPAGSPLTRPRTRSSFVGDA